MTDPDEGVVIVESFASNSVSESLVITLDSSKGFGCSADGDSSSSRDAAADMVCVAGKQDGIRD